jgi:hypothetical protein
MVNHASDEDTCPERAYRVEGPLLNPTGSPCSGGSLDPCFLPAGFCPIKLDSLNWATVQLGQF